MSILARTVFVSLAFALLFSTQAAISQTAGPATPDSVRFFQHDEVAAGFQKGATIVDASNYKVMTAKRDHPGEVEVHKKFTDVIYIVDGNATMMAGGKIVGEKAADTDEPRGTSIDGGKTYQLAPGDVIVIPAGTPHWINQVPGLFHYFVVKVPKSAE